MVVSSRRSAKYNIQDRTTLLKILERVPDGIPQDDLIDCYPGIRTDLEELTRSGQLIYIRNLEKAAAVYFPRNFIFLTQLHAAAVNVTGPSMSLSTSKDATKEVRRGDAIQMEHQWFRLSQALKVIKQHSKFIYVMMR